jgi:hypothetical protein
MSNAVDVLSKLQEFTQIQSFQSDGAGIVVQGNATPSEVVT